MIGWERIQGGKANLKRWVLSFERNVETDNELRVSGGREFQSLGAMTEKALLGRLLNLKRFICKKAQFVIDALFDWKPM